MSPPLCSTLLVGLALAMVTAAGAAAEPVAWDQAEVTKLARQLSEAAGDLRTSVRQTPPVPGGVHRRARARALDDLRVIQNAIRHLARSLEAGEGREDTYPTYRRIETLRRDLAAEAGKARLVEPTLSKLERARAILDRLGPYYEEEAAAVEADVGGA